MHHSASQASRAVTGSHASEPLALSASTTLRGSRRDWPTNSATPAQVLLQASQSCAEMRAFAKLSSRLSTGSAVTMCSLSTPQQAVTCRACVVTKMSKGAALSRVSMHGSHSRAPHGPGARAEAKKCAARGAAALELSEKCAPATGRRSAKSTCTSIGSNLPLLWLCVGVA